MRTKVLRLLLSAVEMVSLLRTMRRLMSQQNALAAQRRKARHFALQALYQWTLIGGERD